MNQLLHWSIENKTGEPSAEIDPKWIDVILGKTDALHIQEQFEAILQSDVPQQIQLLQQLEDYCADIDRAKAFTDWKYIAKLVEIPALAPHVYHLLGTIMQNNLEAQRPFLNYFDWTILDNMACDQLTLDKLMYCLCAMMPLNEDVLASFVEANGFQRVLAVTGTEGMDMTKVVYFLNKNKEDALNALSPEDLDRLNKLQMQ